MLEKIVHVFVTVGLVLMPFEGVSSAWAETSLEEVAEDAIEVNDYEALGIEASDIYEGQPETVAFVASQEGEISEAELSIVNAANGDSFKFEAVQIFENAALFEFGNNLSVGTYELTDVTYALEGTTYVVSLGTGDISFQVVEAAGSGTTVYYLNDDDEVVEAASIGDAITQATTSDDGVSLLSLADEALDLPKIALDAGHGGVDTGALGNGLIESDLTWMIADACRNRLNECGYDTFMVREQYGNYSTSDYRERVQRAIDAGCNVYISFHINSAEIASAKGVEVYTPKKQDTLGSQLSMELSEKVIEKLTALGFYNRGVRNNDALAIMRGTYNAGMPGILIEHGFISNSEDAAKLTAEGCAAMGRVDAEAIMEQFKLPQESDYSSVYDYNYYVKNNPDVAAAYGGDRVKTFLHFYKYGISEGRAGKAGFDSSKHAIMFRLYNPYTGEHFYTSSLPERTNLISTGWRGEGVGWVAVKSSNTPVYRLYNKYVTGGDHHYTTSAEERDNLVKEGWIAEGTGWYSDDAQGTTLLRQYNPYAETGTHNYTTSQSENDNLVKEGWLAEGIAWYGVTL